THNATQAATQNSAKQTSRSRIARPNAVAPNSGTNAPTSNTERSESLAVAKSRYTGIATSPSTDETTNVTDTARRCTRGARPTTGRRISTRRTNRPIAAITVTNVNHRMTSIRGVVAVPEICRTRTWRAGPGF